MPQRHQERYPGSDREPAHTVALQVSYRLAKTPARCPDHARIRRRSNRPCLAMPRHGFRHKAKSGETVRDRVDHLCRVHGSSFTYRWQLCPWLLAPLPGSAPQRRRQADASTRSTRSADSHRPRRGGNSDACRPMRRRVRGCRTEPARGADRCGVTHATPRIWGGGSGIGWG
jgi:hypothetical protein